MRIGRNVWGRKRKAHREHEVRVAESASRKQPKDNGKEQGAIRRTKLARRRAILSAQDGLTALQHATGNRAFSQWLQQIVDCQASPAGPESSSVPPQSKLNIGEPEDRFEQEADNLAEQVVSIRQSPETYATPALSDRAPGAALSTGAPPVEGRLLPASMAAFFGSRFRTDLSKVRVHTGARASQAAALLNARAFTAGNDIVFGEGQYAPQTTGGLRLLAHELTHVAQQDVSPVAPKVQGSFFGDVWEGIKSAGRAVGGAISSAAEWVGARARDVGRFLTGAAEWAGERLRDAAMWVVNLIRDLPARLTRLATTLWEGLAGVVTFIPEAIQALASGGLGGFASWLWEKAKRGGAWVLTLLSRVFDVLGGPELLEFILHLVTKARPLTGEEVTAGSSVLGPSAIRWGDVRVSEGGLLELVFALNQGRAFVTFHTINLPSGEGIDTVVHELTHVYQYERAGSVYLGQALHAQAARGAGAYNYGGPVGLVAAKNSGKHYRDFNREEQAQISQDYYKYVILGQGTLTADERQAYDFFIGELRAGEL
jgi:hypothetical protein